MPLLWRGSNPIPRPPAPPPPPPLSPPLRPRPSDAAGALRVCIPASALLVCLLLMGTSASVASPVAVRSRSGGLRDDNDPNARGDSMQRRMDTINRSSFSQLVVSNIKVLMDETIQLVSGKVHQQGQQHTSVHIDNVPAGEPAQLGSFHEQFSDSTYVRQWLTKEEADELYEYFLYHGEKMRPKEFHSKDRCPTWCKNYGLVRALDGAIALDRWGTNCERWLRIEEAPEILVRYAAKMRKDFHLSADAVNSFSVNFYYDGEHCYMPAHRDTVGCLADGSTINCVSLGATRDFILTENADLGGHDLPRMTVCKAWPLSHGDFFAIGPETNERYLHAVPQDVHVRDMRISIVFRTVDKSFLDKSGPVKDVTYANGRTRIFSAECITCRGIQDPGRREHIADIISHREGSVEARDYRDRERDEKEGSEERKDREGAGGMLSFLPAALGHRGGARKQTAVHLSTVEEERTGMFSIMLHPESSRRWSEGRAAPH